MYLLDTDVVSELRNIRSGRANANVASWARSVPGSSLYLSVIVVQEIEIGIAQLARRDAAQAAILRQRLDNQVLLGFANRILPIDLGVAQYSAGLYVPDPKPYRDGFMGATAHVYGMTLVTRNTGDFAAMRVNLFKPWAD